MRYLPLDLMYSMGKTIGWPVYLVEPNLVITSGKYLVDLKLLILYQNHQFGLLSSFLVL